MEYGPHFHRPGTDRTGKDEGRWAGSDRWLGEWPGSPGLCRTPGLGYSRLQRARGIARVSWFGFLKSDLRFVRTVLHRCDRWCGQAGMRHPPRGLLSRCAIATIVLRGLSGCLALQSDSVPARQESPEWMCSK